MKNRFALILIFLALTTLAQTPAIKPNVVLITIDTLRADRLGCYGYTKAQTPNLDRLASEGILFANAVSHVPLTRPSHASIFSGLYPFEHGIHDNIASPLNSKIPVLAETLKQNGYRTAAFVASFVINSQSGLQRGFDQYADRFDPKKQPTDFAMTLEKRGSEILEEFKNWKSTTARAPYFAWLHLYDPHFPYAPPSPYSKSFADRPYDGEVAYTDEIIGKALKLFDKNTLLILTSDHGESLGDHGENAHSYYIYDATLHVPLIFHWPGRLPAKQKVMVQARSIDLYPTILDLISIQKPSKLSGVSLKPWLNTQQPADPAHPSYSEAFTPWLHFGWSRLIGVRHNGWKYIEAPRAELYNLYTDPGELKNVYSQQKNRANQMKQWLSKVGALENKPLPSAPEMDPEMMEKLASLGYAGGGTTPPATGNLADPKDKIEDFKLFNRLVREGVEDFQNQRYKDAASKFQTLKDRNVPSFEVHYYLGRSLLLLKSYDKSSMELALAIQKLPHFLPAYRDLADAEEGRKRPEQAEKVLLEGLKVAPGNPTVTQPLAWLYQRQKRYKDAERILVEQLKKFPDDPEGMYRLAAVYRDTQRQEQALAQLRQIVKKYPNEAEAHNQIGMIYGAQKKLQEAYQSFSTAAKLAPNDEHIRKNLEIVNMKMAAAPASTVRFRIIQARTRTAAETILRKLQQGVAWEDLARDYSIHPSARSDNAVLETSSTDLDPALQRPLASLKPGEISSVIEANATFFLLRKEQ
jgi:arylsulfatase A-like enzyme/Flp pilus assembly protein TadD